MTDDGERLADRDRSDAEPPADQDAPADRDAPADAASETDAAAATEREAASDADPGDASQPARPARERGEPDGVESFLHLEAELAAGVEGRVRGRAVDARRVPRTEAPDGYPLDLGSPEVLALDLALEPGTGATGAAGDPDTVTVYLEWEDGATDGRLARLLALHEVDPGRFGDLYGRSMLVRSVDGHFVPVVPAEPPRGDCRGVYGILAGLGVNLFGALLLAVGPGGLLTSGSAVAAWLALNVVGVPVATYLDAWHLRTHTDWEQGPSFWALLGALPGVNVFSSLVYLRTRREAEPVA